MRGHLPNPVGWELPVPCLDPSWSSFHHRHQCVGPATQPGEGACFVERVFSTLE